MILITFKRSIIMDEFNNNPNPFNEDKNTVPGNEYNTPPADPYNQQPVQNSYPQQNGQQNPYPGQQNPYTQQQQYNAPNGQYQQNYTYNQQNIPQQGYARPQGYAPYGMPYQQPQSTGMAVASLVLGIISIVTGLFMFSFPVLFLLPIIGLILGIVYKTKKFSVGKGLSTAGIVTSALGLLIPLALLILVVVLLLTNGAELMEYIKQTSPEQYEELYELYGEQFPDWFSGIMSFIIK